MSKKKKPVQEFYSSLFIIAQNWEQPKCPLPDGWINKMWYSQTMKYHPAIKGDPQQIRVNN